MDADQRRFIPTDFPRRANPRESVTTRFRRREDGHSIPRSGGSGTRDRPLWFRACPRRDRAEGLARGPCTRRALQTWAVRDRRADRTRHWRLFAPGALLGTERI